MEITMKKVDELEPYNNNPRINLEAINPVMESISEYGFKVPLVITDENVIITGHTRLAAAKKLNMKQVPCIIASDLTREQIKAFRLADNKTGEIAKWDYVALEEELAEIEMIDMRRFGFEVDAEIEALELELSTPNKNVKTEHCPKCGFEFEVQQ